MNTGTDLDIRIDYFPVQRELLYNDAIELFNRNPEFGRQFLVANKVIRNTADEFAGFILSAPRLNKRKISEYFATKAIFNQQVCFEAFNKYPLQGVRFEEAIRYLLKSIQLPREGNQLETVIEIYARSFHNQNPDLVMTKDALQLLFTRLIALNAELVDARPTLYGKTTQEQFLSYFRSNPVGILIKEELICSLFRRFQNFPCLMTDNDLFQCHHPEFLATTKVGWLLKRKSGYLGYSWSRRWFVLDSGCLYYFSCPSSPHPQAILPLSNANVTFIPAPDARHMSTIAISCAEYGKALKLRNCSRLMLGANGREWSVAFRNKLVIRESDSELKSWMKLLTEDVEMLSVAASWLANGNCCSDEDFSVTLSSPRQVCLLGTMNRRIESKCILLLGDAESKIYLRKCANMQIIIDHDIPIYRQIYVTQANLDPQPILSGEWFTSNCLEHPVWSSSYIAIFHSIEASGPVICWFPDVQSYFQLCISGKQTQTRYIVISRTFTVSMDTLFLSDLCTSEDCRCESRVIDADVGCLDDGEDVIWAETEEGDEVLNKRWESSFLVSMFDIDVELDSPTMDHHHHHEHDSFVPFTNATSAERNKRRRAPEHSCSLSSCISTDPICHEISPSQVNRYEPVMLGLGHRTEVVRLVRSDIHIQFYKPTSASDSCTAEQLYTTLVQLISHSP